jgi:Na+-translocating ferredoxin:NAD+ oxidoreductase RnfG subunit
MRGFGIMLTVLAIAVGPALGQVRMTTEAALKLAFPKCKIERRTITLTKNQKAEISKRCGQKFEKSMVFAYVARRDGKLVGTGWFDVHKVRSKRQLLMIAITPEHTVHRVEVLAFAEPRRYAAPPRWLRKFKNKRLGHVQPGRDVPRITGATITVRATTRCVERNLALHRTVFDPPKSKTEPKPKRDPKSKPKSAKDKESKPRTKKRSGVRKS